MASSCAVGSAGSDAGLTDIRVFLSHSFQTIPTNTQHSLRISLTITNRIHISRLRLTSILASKNAFQRMSCVFCKPRSIQVLTDTDSFHHRGSLLGLQHRSQPHRRTTPCRAHGATSRCWSRQLRRYAFTNQNIPKDESLIRVAGPIVNVVTYTAAGCTNPGTTSQNLNLLKFAPIPTEPNKDFESRCEQVSLPTEDDATAKSFAFIADGFTRDCYLVTYSGDNCGSNDARTQALRFGSSRCINEVIGSVKVYCLASRATVPRDVGDDETGDTSPVLPWNEVQ